MKEEDGVVDVTRVGFGGNPPASELRFSGLSVVELDLLIRRAWRCGDGARWVKDELPASLIEEQAEGRVAANQGYCDDNAQGGEQPFAADELLRCSACLFHFFSCGSVFRHGALSKSEFVGGFEGRAADSADNGGAIAADERVIYFSGTIGTPEDFFFGCGWIRGLIRGVVHGVLRGHSDDERSMRGRKGCSAETMSEWLSL